MTTSTIHESPEDRTSASAAVAADDNGDWGYDIDDSNDTRGTGNSAADNGEGPICIDGGSGNEVEVNGEVYTEEMDC